MHIPLQKQYAKQQRNSTNQANFGQFKAKQVLYPK